MLAGLQKGVFDDIICVKVLSFWFEYRYRLGSLCQMILADSSVRSTNFFICLHQRIHSLLWFCKLANLLFVFCLEGQKIEATIPNNYHVKEYAERLKEREWFILSELDVADPVSPITNTDHVYQIIFNYKTWFLPFDNISDSCFLQFN